MRTFKTLFQTSKANTKFDGQAHIKAMYDDRWAKYSKEFLTINQVCYSCGEKSEVTDHLTPAKGDEKLFKKLDNHIPLCAQCHNTITAKFDKKYRPGNSINQKLMWLYRNRLTNSITVRVKVLPKYEV